MNRYARFNLVLYRYKQYVPLFINKKQSLDFDAYYYNYFIFKLTNDI